MGRAASASVLEREFPEHDVVSSSPVAIDADHPTPRALTVDEIRFYIEEYAQAASNAIAAGADGVEIHGANGYLPDQFLQDVVNHRTDRYGGSVENRSRFLLEVMDAVSARIGQDRVAVRLSPWSKFQSMGETDPRPLFTYLVGQLRDRFPSLAYIHLLEPRGDLTVTDFGAVDGLDVNFLRDLWQQGDASRVFLSAGGHTRQSAIEKAEGNQATVAVFGRHFISNPDLPLRLKYNAPLQAYDRSTFYVAGPEHAEGYTTYKTLDEAVNLVAAKA